MSDQLLKEPFKVDCAIWTEYCLPVSSSLFQRHSVIPVELLVIPGIFDKEADRSLLVNIRRKNGSILMPIGRLYDPEKRLRFDEETISLEALNTVLKILREDQAFLEQTKKAIAALQAPDPFVLPQRNHPDFFSASSGDIEPIISDSVSDMVPVRAMGIRDDRTIILKVDILRNAEDPLTFLRVWANWCDDDTSHLVCWLTEPNTGELLDANEVMKTVLSSEDFLHRIHLLHDRWRTAQGLPSVSTPEEMTLLPVQEDRQKASAPGGATPQETPRTISTSWNTARKESVPLASKYETFDVSYDHWSMYRFPVSSSEYLPGTDIPLEVMIMLCDREDPDEGVAVRIAVTRRGGTLLAIFSHLQFPEAHPGMYDAVVHKLVEDLHTNPELSDRWPSVLPGLQEEDPYALPQREIPDFLHRDGEPMIQTCYGFGGDLPAKLMGIRGEVEIELQVDVMHHPKYPQTFLRVWAIWPEQEDGHLVGWLLLSDVKPNEDLSSLFLRVLRSKDFSRRIHLLHDMWRSSQGLPPVSTQEEKTLLPIPEGLPKAAARGLSSKRRKRR